MALAVTVFYRVLGTSVRNVGMLQEQQTAVLLANSILSSKDVVGEDGWNEEGESDGFSWQVRSGQYATPVPLGPGVTSLHSVQISISWQEAGDRRRIEFNTLRPQRRPVGGGNAS